MLTHDLGVGKRVGLTLKGNLLFDAVAVPAKLWFQAGFAVRGRARPRHDGHGQGRLDLLLNSEALPL